VTMAEQARRAGLNYHCVESRLRRGWRLEEALARPSRNPPSGHIPEFTAAEEELADLVIRVMDFAAGRGHRLAEAILAKHAFNAHRPRMHGGKAF
jgi:hypothetical protein